MKPPSTMHAARRPPRPFFLSDGMVLVAATAFGLGLAVFWRRELADELPAFNIADWSTGRRTQFAGYSISALLPASLAVLLLRLRPPRPRLWLVARQPGASACVAAAITLAGQTLALPLDLRTMGSFPSPLLVAAFYWPTAVGAVVLTAWLLLVAGRRWHPNGDWVDRLGMAVGVCWIALPFVLSIIEFS